MAMKVLTLPKLKELLDAEVGVVHTLEIENDKVYFKGADGVISYETEKENIEDLDKAYPFLKYREFVEGKMVVRGNLLPDAILKPYIYMLD